MSLAATTVSRRSLLLLRSRVIASSFTTSTTSTGPPLLQCSARVGTKKSRVGPSVRFESLRAFSVSMGSQECMFPPLLFEDIGIPVFGELMAEQGKDSSEDQGQESDGGIGWG